MAGLRGFVGQDMDGRRSVASGYVATFPVGSHVWTCPKTGKYRFVQWGAGGRGTSATAYGGSSGAHAQSVRFIFRGQTVAITVAGPTADVPENTTVVLPDITVVTTSGGRGGSSSVPGVATGGDLNIEGSPGGAPTIDGSPGFGDAAGSGGAANQVHGGGAGAPGFGNFRGGDGGALTSGPYFYLIGGTPGAGSRGDAEAGTGLVIVAWER